MFVKYLLGQKFDLPTWFKLFNPWSVLKTFLTTAASLTWFGEFPLFWTLVSQSNVDIESSGWPQATGNKLISDVHNIDNSKNCFNIFSYFNWIN